MAYKCPECGEIFEEPEFTETYWESECGVSSWFDSRHTVTFASCPACGEAIDVEYDSYDEEEGDESDE